MLKKILGCVLLVLLVAGCSMETKDKSISFKYALTSLISETKVLSKSLSASPVSRCDVYVYPTGTMTVKNKDTGDVTRYPWQGQLNTETFAITSTKPIVLKPGYYDFVLELKIYNYLYVGKSEGIIIEDGVNNVIPMNISSVIGEVGADFDVTQFSSLRFKYYPDEFKNISEPRIGCIIDDLSTSNEFISEVILSFDKNTGITETYISLLPGSYRIQLKFYDGNIQIGKSITQQEAVTISLKNNLVMDIVPLHAEAAFDLHHIGGTATFTFAIPPEVVAETDGTDNLWTDFQLYSQTGNNTQYSGSVAITGTPENGYTGSVSIEGFQYDTVTISLTFIDMRDGEPIGACGQEDIQLSSLTQNFTLKLDLLRRAIISGHLKAVMGIHVISKNNKDVNGVKISFNNEFAGVTGSASNLNNTKGYLKRYQQAGPCEIKAEYMCNGCKYEAVTNLTISPLGIYNVEIILENLQL